MHTLGYCQTPELPILPSPALDWKIWTALFLRGCSVRCLRVPLVTVLMAFEDAQVIPSLYHLLGYFWDTFEILLGYFVDI